MKKDTRVAKSLAKELKRLVVKNFGQKCRDYNFGCVVCQANRVADECHQLSGLLERLDKMMGKKFPKSLASNRSK